MGTGGKDVVGLVIVPEMTWEQITLLLLPHSETPVKG